MPTKLINVARIFILFIIPLLILPFQAYAQTAKDAYKALKRLEARTETGISVRDYAPALGDAKVELNLFIESPESKKNQALSKSLQKAMEHYQSASTVMGYKVVGGRVQEFIPISSEFAQIMLKKYPAANAPALDQNNKIPENPGALVSVSGQKNIYLNQLILIIWQEASKELKRSAKLISSK